MLYQRPKPTFAGCQMARSAGQSPSSHPDRRKHPAMTFTVSARVWNSYCEDQGSSSESHTDTSSDFIVALASVIMKVHKTGSDYTPISIKAVADAARTVLGVDPKERDALCDQIHADQPHVFLTTVALSQSGVSLAKVDHALHLLMVIYLAFKDSTGIRLPVIGLDMIDDAYKKLASMMTYLAIEPDRRMWNLTAMFHPEPNLLAYVVGYLRDHNFHVETDEHARVISVAKMTLDIFVAAKKRSSSRSAH